MKRSRKIATSLHIARSTWSFVWITAFVDSLDHKSVLNQQMDGSLEKIFAAYEFEQKREVFPLYYCKALF